MFASVAASVTSPPPSIVSSTHVRRLGSTAGVSDFFVALLAGARAILSESTDEGGGVVFVEVFRFLRLAKEVVLGIKTCCLMDTRRDGKKNFTLKSKWNSDT